MDQNYETILDLKLERTKRNLEQRQFSVQLLPNKEALLDYLTKTLPQGASVNLGGSMTLFETGVIDLLSTLPISFQNRYAKDADVPLLYRQAFSADYYLTSTNAISEEGELFNVDGNGNRTAAMIFGPAHVIVIASSNKLVKNEEEAWQRIREYAAPANCVRLHRDTPCTKTGCCVNCQAADRICASYVKIARSQTPQRITVVLLKEQYGY